MEPGTGVTARAPALDPVVRRDRRRRSLTALTAALGVLAIVAGALLVITARLGRGDAGSTVQDYFAAIEQGDAAGALAYGPVPGGDTQYLTDAVLREQLSVADMHDAAVLAVDVHGGQGAVLVQYVLGFAAGSESITDRVPVQKADGRWRLSASAVRTTVQLGQGNARATLAGTSLPTASVLLFPGAVPIRFDSPLIELSASKGAVEFSSSAVVASSQVSAQAISTIGPLLDAALNACLRATSAAALNCPLPQVSPNRAVPNSVRGRPVKPLSATATYVVAGSPSGFVTAQATVRVTGSYQSLTFDNVLSTVHGTFDLPVVAQVDLLDPDQVAWL